MQYAGTPAGNEQQAPCHSSVIQGSGLERRQLVEAELRESSERAFEAYRDRQVLTEGDYDWLSVLGNLGKARKSWGRL